MWAVALFAAARSAFDLHAFNVKLLLKGKQLKEDDNSTAALAALAALLSCSKAQAHRLSQRKRSQRQRSHRGSPRRQQQPRTMKVMAIRICGCRGPPKTPLIFSGDVRQKNSDEPPVRRIAAQPRPQ